MIGFIDDIWSLSHLESQDVQHVPLLALTWTDVALREVIVSGQDPLDAPGGGGGRGGPQPPGGGCQGRRPAAAPARKFPKHAAFVSEMPARSAGIHRLCQEEDPPRLGALLHL